MPAQNNFQIAMLFFRKFFKNLPFKLWASPLLHAGKLWKSMALNKNQRIAMLFFQKFFKNLPFNPQKEYGVKQKTTNCDALSLNQKFN